MKRKTSNHKKVTKGKDSTAPGVHHNDNEKLKQNNLSRPNIKLSIFCLRILLIFYLAYSWYFSNVTLHKNIQKSSRAQRQKLDQIDSFKGFYFQTQIYGSRWLLTFMNNWKAVQIFRSNDLLQLNIKLKEIYLHSRQA